MQDLTPLPDCDVRVDQRLLEDEDGPLLDLLKKAHATAIQVPTRKTLQPDRELLAVRFDAFRSAACDRWNEEDLAPLPPLSAPSVSVYMLAAS